MTISVQCLTCAHYRGAMTCDAFPDPEQIPGEILSGAHDHRDAFAGDHGVRWAQDPDAWDPDAQDAISRPPS